MAGLRLILVDNLIYEESYTIRKYDLQPNLGLLSLMAVAYEVGHEAEIYDPKWDLVRGRLEFDASLYQDIARRILARLPDAVGFTALGCNFHCVAGIAGHLKQMRPDLPILLGGPHATILHREILQRFPAFDVVVRHEAERTLPSVLERLPTLDLHGIEGVSFRSAAGDVLCNPGSPLIDDLDTLPMPAYDRYPLAELGLRTIRVEAGRGCPFSCTFCSTASFFGRQFRVKTADRLLSELDYLHQTFGYTDFKLNHDLFTVNRKKVAEFCEVMLKRRYTWSCSARVDCVDPDLLCLMQRAGCRDIYFGIETGSERMQSVSRKRLDLSLVEPTLDLAARLGMHATASFITGFPEETLEDQTLTLDLVGRIFCSAAGQTISQLHLLTPEPGTHLMATYGDRLRFDGHITDFNFPRLEADDGILIANDRVIFSNHHYYPSVLPRGRHVFVASTWTLLWIAGPMFLDYVLRAFGGRLSRFMNEAYDWYADRPRTNRNIGHSDLLGFLAERFGERHHVVSLFRYALAANAVLGAARRGGASARATHSDKRDAALGIAPTAAVLRDIHDCVGLVERISATKPESMVDDSICGSLGHLLLIRSNPNIDGADGEVLTYAIDGPTADLIDRFSEPKSYWECCRDIAEEDDAAGFPDWEDINRLCELGILEIKAIAERGALLDAVQLS